jgi:hypothetical protein
VQGTRPGAAGGTQRVFLCYYVMPEAHRYKGHDIRESFWFSRIVVSARIWIREFRWYREALAFVLIFQDEGFCFMATCSYATRVEQN